MRSIKMIGIAAVAALVASVALGAGSASADSFCTAVVNHKGECPPGSVIALPVTIEASKVVAGKEPNDFTAGEEEAFEPNCNEVKLKAKFTQNAGSHNQVTGNLEEILWNNCTGCSAITTENVPWVALALALELHIVFHKSGTSGFPSFLFSKCTSFKFNCLYDAELPLLSIENGTATTPVYLKASVSMLKSTAGGHSGVCPTPITWNTKFEVTAPANLKTITALP